MIFNKKAWSLFGKKTQDQTIRQPESPTPEKFAATQTTVPAQTIASAQIPEPVAGSLDPSLEQTFRDEQDAVQDELTNIQAIENSLKEAADIIRSTITCGKLKRIKNRQVIGFSLDADPHLGIDDIRNQVDAVLPKLSRALDDCCKIKETAQSIKTRLEQRRHNTEEKLLDFEAKAIVAVADIDKAIHDVAKKLSQAKSWEGSPQLKQETKNPDNQFSWLTKDTHKTLVSDFANPILNATRTMQGLSKKIEELYQLEQNVMV